MFYSRDPKSIVKPLSKNATDDDKYNEKLEAAKSKAVRHLILIRHGQYNLDGITDDQRYLTEIGKSIIQRIVDRKQRLTLHCSI